MCSPFLKVSAVHATLVGNVRSVQAFHKFVLTLSSVPAFFCPCHVGLPYMTYTI